MAFPIGRVKHWHSAAMIVVVALAARTAFGLVSPTSMLRNPHDDPDSYARFAHVLATDGTFGPAPDQPSAYRPPGYPVLLSPWCVRQPPKVWGIFLLHLVLSAGIVGFTWILAHQVGASSAAWTACFLAAVDPLLIRQSSLIMSETLFTFLFAAVLTLWLRGVPPIGLRRAVRKRTPLRFHALRELAMRLPSKQSIPVSDVDVNTLAFYQSPPQNAAIRCLQWVGAGVALGSAILVRPIALAFWLAIALPAFFQKRAIDWIVIAAIAAACCSPWALRNYRQFGEWVVATTHGGYTLWLGQNPEYYRQVVDGPHSVWPDESFNAWTEENLQSTEGMSERERDRYFREQALSWMKSRPSQAAWSTVHHVGSMWSPMPNIGPVEARRVCLLFYLILFSVAAVGLADRWIWTTDLIALPFALLSFTAVHAFYWSDIRMRAPLTPVLAVLFAAAIQRLFPAAPPRKESKLPWR